MSIRPLLYDSGLDDMNTDPMFFDSFVFMTSKDQNAFRQINVIGVNKKERIEFGGSGETSDRVEEELEGNFG